MMPTAVQAVALQLLFLSAYEATNVVGRVNIDATIHTVVESTTNVNCFLVPHDLPLAVAPSLPTKGFEWLMDGSPALQGWGVPFQTRLVESAANEPGFVKQLQVLYGFSRLSFSSHQRALGRVATQLRCSKPRATRFARLACR